MRPVLLGALVLSLIGAPAASAHHKPTHKPVDPPAVAQLAGSVTVSGVGAAVVDVVLPAAGELVQPITTPTSPGWGDVTTDGTWAAVALLSADRRLASGNPEGAYEISMSGLDGCPATLPTPVADGGCLRPYNAVAWATASSPRIVDGSYHYAFPPGRYRLIVATEPGRHVSARFVVAGLVGSVTLSATQPVDVRYERDRVEDPALAVLTSSHRSESARPVVGLVGLWYTTAGDEPGEFEYAECVTPGDAAPLNPTDCPPSGISGVVAPAGLGKRPTWFAGSYGGFSLTNSNIVAFQLPRLEPGVHTNSVRVTRGGRGPAVGSFAFWLAD
jgi:hypothetical protein